MNTVTATESSTPLPIVPSRPGGYDETDAQTVPTDSVKLPRLALQSQNNKSKSSGLLIRPLYLNTMPDPPFDCKSVVQRSLNPTRFIKYSTSELEKKIQYDIHTPPDMGLNVDLVLPPEINPWFPPPKPNSSGEAADTPATPAEDVFQSFAFDSSELDKKDQELLDAINAAAANKLTKFRAGGKFGGIARSELHQKSCAWLRKTDTYISDEPVKYQSNPHGSQRVESKVGHGMQEYLPKWYERNNRETQIKSIEKTFVDAVKPITEHYANKDVVPVEVLPIFPDFDLWKYPFAQVSYDVNPAPSGRTISDEQMAHTMIRGVKDDDDEEFVAHFVIDDDSFQAIETKKAKILADKPDENTIEHDWATYGYTLAREYNYKLIPREFKTFVDHFFFCERDGAIYYNEIDTRIQLQVRRNFRSQQPKLKSKLYLTDVPPSVDDCKMYSQRERYLEPIACEADVEEDDDFDFVNKTEEENVEQQEQLKNNVKNEYVENHLDAVTAAGEDVAMEEYVGGDVEYQDNDTDLIIDEEAGAGIEGQYEGDVKMVASELEDLID